MAYTIKRLYFGTPGTTNGTLYTATGVSALVKQIIIANTTATAATITLALNGTSATAANQFAAAVSIAPNHTETLDLSLPMVANDTIQALQGTASALNVAICGVEY